MTKVNDDKKLLAQQVKQNKAKIEQKAKSIHKTLISTQKLKNH